MSLASKKPDKAMFGGEDAPAREEKEEDSSPDFEALGQELLDAAASDDAAEVGAFLKAFHQLCMHE